MCRKCQSSRRKRISGMKGNKALKTGLQVAGGFVAANALSKIPMVAANPVIGAVAPIAIAMFLGKTIGPQISVGMIAGGTVNAVKAFAPSVATTLGIGTPYASYNNPGIAAANGGQYRNPVIINN